MADIFKLSDADAIRRAKTAPTLEPDSAFWCVLSPLDVGVAMAPKFEVHDTFADGELGHYAACQHAAWLAGKDPERGPYPVRRYVLDGAK